jgi:nucleoside-diphosphate-sugar epimerase
MAMHRIIEAALLGRRFQLFGDGTQVRDFTYVDDVVGANVAAAGADVAPGTVVNIAGGSSVSMLEVIELVAELAGRAVRVERGGSQAGDVTRTGASSDLAREMLGWEPRVTLRSGLGAQVTSAYEMAGK